MTDEQKIEAAAQEALEAHWAKRQYREPDPTEDFLAGWKAARTETDARVQELTRKGEQLCCELGNQYVRVQGLLMALAKIKDRSADPKKMNGSAFMIADEALREWEGR